MSRMICLRIYSVKRAEDAGGRDRGTADPSARSRHAPARSGGSRAGSSVPPEEFGIHCQEDVPDIAPRGSPSGRRRPSGHAVTAIQSRRAAAGRTMKGLASAEAIRTASASRIHTSAASSGFIESRSARPTKRLDALAGLFPQARLPVRLMAWRNLEEARLRGLLRHLAARDPLHQVIPARGSHERGAGRTRRPRPLSISSIPFEDAPGAEPTRVRSSRPEHSRQRILAAEAPQEMQPESLAGRIGQHEYGAHVSCCQMHPECRRP